MANDEQTPSVDAPQSRAEMPDQPRSEAADKQRLVQQLGEALLAAIEQTTPATTFDAEVPANEFVEALEQLHEAGWSFDESIPARLVRVSEAPATQSEVDALVALQERYPALPRETTDVIWAVLTGVQASADNAPKHDAVRRLILTEDVRERFYLKHCGKVPRYASIDWEVVLKAAERGHNRTPAFPYALATLDTIADVHGQHEHKTLTFALGRKGLERLIEELTELKSHLDRVYNSSPLEDDLRGTNA
ncbi:hypothetical protein [Haliangium sp.]|uniref:hypothetical protein n=1 Tax=Haliangium sp. TaxID=2663208 RepID=UPI003D0C2217